VFVNKTRILLCACIGVYNLHIMSVHGYGSCKEASICNALQDLQHLVANTFLEEDRRNLMLVLLISTHVHVQRVFFRGHVYS
jgi:hypothetical protein